MEEENEGRHKVSRRTAKATATAAAGATGAARRRTRPDLDGRCTNSRVERAALQYPQDACPPPCRGDGVPSLNVLALHFVHARCQLK
jgi:hypothetical protein